jgi:hypothetical protein
MVPEGEMGDAVDVSRPFEVSMVGGEERGEAGEAKKARSLVEEWTVGGVVCV